MSLNVINWKLLPFLLIEWRPNMMTIEEVKNLKTITTEELLGSLIVDKHTLDRNRKEKEVEKKKKNDLALQLLLFDNDDKDMTSLARKYKTFLNNKEVAKTGEKKIEENTML